MRRYKEAEVAGLKLLSAAIKRNVDRVEQRYRNRATREACQALSALADEIVVCAENDLLFTVYLAQQYQLPGFAETDEAYGFID